MLRRLVALGCMVLSAASFTPALWAPARAEEPRAVAAEPQSNVRVTIRMGKLDQGKRTVLKTYELVVAAGSPGSKLLSGARVPIPTVAPGSTDTPLVYQNIGFSIEAQTWLVGDRKIKLLAEVEDSRLKERGPSAPPAVETRQLSLNAILTDGVPMEVTRLEAEALTDPSGFVEVEAKILK